MKREVYRRLSKLSQESDKEYGKLIQKLLAIAFCKAGATRLVERSIQGIDLEVTLPDERKIAVEVKTAQEQCVKFGKKDLDGLASQAEAALEPCFALLGSQLLDEWILARSCPNEIKPNQQYRLTQLRAYRDKGLEESIRQHFDEAVIEFTDLPNSSRQAALDEVLRGFSCVSGA
ncbi:hypothetical protein [Woeseia oceani]|uniref:Uncharacterized protein n=1 Tax=Woeseia oceani TaxID=1548547 RepID=A0A193LHE2_9GAMM|nr:hypothetical protein [Woeseia oceani]ANO51881.1 hypothetical protein BA177_12320 [Woeseia oceani]